MTKGGSLAGKADGADPRLRIGSGIAVGLSDTHRNLIFRCQQVRTGLTMVSQAYEAWLTAGLASSLFSSMIISSSAERLIAASIRSSSPYVCVHLPASGVI